MKRLMIITLLTLLFPIAANAYDAQIKGIYYNFSGNEATVTYMDFTGSSYISGYSGTVIIPLSVTYNGKIYTVTTIGSSAFRDCSGLTSITIPNSVASIGNGAFYGCSGLTKVIVPDLAAWCRISFSSNPLSYAHHLYSNENTEITDLVIPEGVTSIGNNAFSGCSSLTSITIPNSVTSIGSYAFSSCRSLTSITIPNSVTSIGNNAFSGCRGLTSVTIPNSVTSIDEDVFSGCSSLTSFTIPNSITSIGEHAFQNCPRLRHIYVSSQTPADCIGTKTFYCTIDYARSNYEVYDYAILHVPMGTKEEYAAAYEWRYFAKIKEDLDINGQVFYTTLSVNHAGDGYVKHYVKADDPYTLYIGSEEGMRVNTVTFNGEDVTDKLVDGYYTTPNITRPSKIVVSFEQDPDKIALIPAEDNLHVYGNEGSLFISGIEGPQLMSVYTLNGMLINSQTLEGDVRIKMSEGTYIVKIGKRTFKVLM